MPLQSCCMLIFCLWYFESNSCFACFDEVVGKLSNHFGPYMFVLDIDFTGLRPRQLNALLGTTRSGGQRYMEDLGLATMVLTHKAYGGIMIPDTY